MELSPQRSRWRVVITRLPPGPLDAIQSAFPAPREVSEALLPLVVRTTTDLYAAQMTASRLREAGAVVVLMEEPEQQDAFCSTHTSRLAERGCRVCQRPVCLHCLQEADDHPLCPEHASLRQRRQRFLRLRQLFLLFLLAAFSYEALTFFQTDRELVDPSGPVSVAVMQFVEPGFEDTPLIAQLNDPASPSRIQTIADLFNAEHTRYTNQSAAYLRLTILPIMTRQVRPPLLTDGEGGWWAVTRSSWRYLRYFDGLASGLSVSRDDYGAQLFVIYGPQEDDLAAHSRGSKRGRTAIAYVDVAERNPAYALVTLAHELGHTLGAADAYDPQTALSQHPEGFIEPFARPLYPQEFAALMAVDVPLSPGIEGEVRSLNQVRIGYQSAADMRSISQGEAARFYHPDNLRPEDQLRYGAPEAIRQEDQSADGD